MIENQICRFCFVFFLFWEGKHFSRPSGRGDATDNHRLFGRVFLAQTGGSRRTTEKGKTPTGAAFYFQFVFICPPAPLGCLWERVSTCFIGRYCVSGSKSVFTHRCEWRTSVSVPLLFFLVSDWNYLGPNGFGRVSIR